MGRPKKFKPLKCETCGEPLEKHDDAQLEFCEKYAPEKPIVRKCAKCKKTFKAAGRFIFRCDPCKREAARLPATLQHLPPVGGFSGYDRDG